MRIYEGSPRQDWEDVLRSVGAYLDDRGMRGMVFVETDTGFIIQGTAIHGSTGSGESMGQALRETLNLQDDDVGRFMDEAIARRGQAAEPTPSHYEAQLRVIGRYLDEHHPRDIFFFEQEQQFVVRLLMQTRAGLRHMIVEFTREEMGAMIAAGMRARGR